MWKAYYRKKLKNKEGC